MAALTEVLRILIDSNSAGAQADMKKLGLTASETMTKLEKVKAAAMVGAGVGVGAAAVGGVVEGLQRAATFTVNQAAAAINAASQLEQAHRSMRAVFGSAQLELEQFARAAASSLGMSERAVYQNSAAVGSLLQNLGYMQGAAARTSMRLVTVAADLGAAFGRSTEDAMQGLTALLRGEFDTIEKFGIKIKQVDIDARAMAMGLDTSTVAAKNHATAVAAMALAFEQAAKFEGEFAKRSDTLQGQQQRLKAEFENLRAELGKEMTPAMVELTVAAREAVPALGAISRPLATLAGDAASTAAALARATKAIAEFNPFRQYSLFGGGDDLARGWDKAAITATQLPSDIAEQLSLYLRTFGDVLNYTAEQIANLNAEATKGFDTAYVGLFGLFAAQNTFRKSVTDTGTAVTDTASKVEKAYRRIGRAQESVADAQENLNEALIDRFLVALGATSDEVTTAQINEREATRALAASKRDLAKALEDLQAKREIDAAGVMDAEAAYIEAQRAVVAAERSNDYVEKLRANAELIRTQKAYNQSLNPELSDLYAEAQDRVGGAQDDVLRSEIALREARQELVDVTNRGKEGSEELAAANKAVERSQRALRDAEESLTDAQESLAESTDRVAGSQKSVNDKLLEGVSAADGWVKYLINNKRPVEEWNAAISEIYLSLKDVADQAGMTGTLDEFITKATNAYAAVKNLQNLPSPQSAFSSDPMNAFTSMQDAQTRVVMQLDGRTFGEAVVSGLLAYQRVNGSIPIRVG